MVRYSDMQDEEPQRLRKQDWLVLNADIDKARRLVVHYHYAQGASNTAAHLHGLYRKSDLKLMGVAWWIPPTRDAAARWWSNPEEVLTLSRLVLHPDVPKNGATFLLMASVKLLDPRWRCLLTYADTWRGHTGRIYKAAGWEYLGLTDPEQTYTVSDRMVSRKCGPKTRTHNQMIALGATMIGAFPKHRFRLVLPPRRSRKLAAATQKGLFSSQDSAEELVMREADLRDLRPEGSVR